MSLEKRWPFVLIATIMLSACGSPQPSATPPPMTNAPTSGQTAPPADATKLSRIFLSDGTNGWGVANTPKSSVVRTEDGGQHWLRVAIPAVQGDLADIAVIGGPEAFLAYVSDQETTVLRTNDGGQTWQSSTFPLGGSGANLHFLNKSKGWLALHTGVGMNHDWVEFFRTTDGGASWTRLTPDRQHSQPGNLPDVGGKSTPVFVDSNTGWVGQGPVVRGEAGLYRTVDGGRTWQAQRLTLPKESQNATVAVMAPQFFSDAEGVLPVPWYVDDKGTLSLFVTHNGGQSWEGLAPLATGLSGYLHAYFASPQTGWVWASRPSDGSVIAPAYQTQDGGQTWTKVDSPVPHESVRQLDFVSPNQGWALAEADLNGQTKLLATQDGGATWRTVFPDQGYVPSVPPAPEPETGSLALAAGLHVTYSLALTGGVAPSGALVVRNANGEVILQKDGASHVLGLLNVGAPSPVLFIQTPGGSMGMYYEAYLYTPQTDTFTLLKWDGQPFGISRSGLEQEDRSIKTMYREVAGSGWKERYRVWRYVDGQLVPIAEGDQSH